jgi:hypothetical protein
LKKIIFPMVKSLNIYSKRWFASGKKVKHQQN